MANHRIIARLAAEPRAVEVEIAAPLGTPTVAPFERALTTTGARALGTVVFRTVSHVVLVAKLVDRDGTPLDDSRTARLIAAIREELNDSTPAETPSRAA